MNIPKYIDQMKELQDIFLKYIEMEREDSNLFLKLIDHFDTFKFGENREELRELIYLLVSIINNHHRGPDFFERIEKILLYFIAPIKQSFSNFEIFDLFKSNKRILLLLIQNKFITIDQSILICINKTDCRFYLYPEIKKLLTDQERKTIENKLSKINSKISYNFKQVRQTGENDSYICQLIRNDSIDDFVSFVVDIELPLSYEITSSIFETNLFLIDKIPTLIEYAAFFGSFQIFKYLHLNGIDLNPFLWFFAIHGNNFDIINFLVDNNVLLDDELLFRCIEEAIKCHHNEIAEFIQSKYISKENQVFIDNKLDFCFRYFNYHFIPSDLDNEHLFCLSCQYNYFTLVKLLFESKNLKLNSKKIFI